MSNLSNIQRKLSEGVSGWLLFEFNCYRGYMFNEKYLSGPIAQILNSIADYKTLSEINHPCSNSGKGRPLQIDFVLSDKLSTTWKFAFESKWIGNSLITPDAMIWDLIRLQNLFKFHAGIRCYFILAGFEKKITPFLRTHDLTLQSDGTQRPNGLSKVNNMYFEFDLFKLDQNIKDSLNEKLSSYPNFSLFSRIRCRPAHSYPKKDIVNMTFKTCVFEILGPDMTQRIHSL